MYEVLLMYQLQIWRWCETFSLYPKNIAQIESVLKYFSRTTRKTTICNIFTFTFNKKFLP